MSRRAGALGAAVTAAAAIAVALRRRGPDSRALVGRYFDAWAEGDADSLLDLLGNDYRGHVHTLAGTEERTPDELAEVLERHSEAFEWTEFDVRDVLRDDGRVAARVVMRARHRETAREGEIEGLAIFRVRRGRVAEEWSSWDYLGLAEQLGLADVS